MYTRGFDYYIRVHTQVFCIQSRMPLFFPSRGIWMVAGWIVMIAESPLMLLESVYTSISNQRHFFMVNLFFKNVLVIAFSIFCFGITGLEFFYLVLCVSAIWLCLQSLGVVESFFCFSISFFQRIQKYLLLCIIMHCTLHFAWYLH